MATKSMDAVALLKADHRHVKELFKKFEKSDDSQAKSEIADEAIQELKIHDALEEEIFYPAFRQATAEDQEEKDVVNEADEEHHMVRLEIAELEKMGASDERFDAKFTVLAELVRHHIKEEEDEMLPEAKKSELDLKELGQKMMTRKEELKAKGIPKSKEESLVS